MRASISSLCFLAATIWSTTVSSAGCNGDVRLCDRLYSNVSQIGSHDSAFVGSGPSDNQGLSVTAQLDSGIRFLQAQTHLLLGSDTSSLGLYMCHTSCLLLNAGTLTSYLQTITTWLSANPNEVLTLLLVNGDDVDVSLFGTSFASAGLDQFAFVPSGILTLDEWPTLQELIDSGKRIVVFLDTGADTSTVPYINDEFTYFFETPYDTTDPTFPECTLGRPAGGSAAGRMSIVNHFLDINVLGTGILIPDNGADSTTNSPASIEAQCNICFQDYGKTVNFVLLDMDQVGDWEQAQADLNHLD